MPPSMPSVQPRDLTLPFLFPPSSSNSGSLPHPSASPSTTAASSSIQPGVLNPRHALMRLRRVSLPANLVQTNLTALGGYAVSNGRNRMSAASYNSFDGLPEEDDEEEREDDDAGKEEQVRDPFRPVFSSSVGSSSSNSSTAPSPRLLRHPIGYLPHRRRSHSPSTFSLSSSMPIAVTTGFNRPSTSQSSLPTSLSETAHSSKGPSFVRSRSSQSCASPLSRPTSLLDGESTNTRGRISRSRSSASSDDIKRREDRRWRIALELRETERSYVDVLKEIEQHYYLPLLASLPPSPLASRRVSRNISAPTSPIIEPFSNLPPSPTFTALARISTYLPNYVTAPSEPIPCAPILPRNHINEIFSNFTDVITLAQAMLATLQSAIPDRPSDPLSLPSVYARSSINVTPELSSSVETEDDSDDGPITPNDRQSATLQRQTSRNVDVSRRSHDAAPPIYLGKVLRPILPFFKSYAFFISNFAAALSRLSSLESPSNTTTNSSAEDRQRWKKFCDERRVLGMGRGLGLGGLLLNIVQRVPRYRVLLSDLVKYTERDHPDAPDLLAAFQVVDGVATFLEHQIQAHTNVLQMLELQRSFTNLDSPLLLPGRSLVKSGQLRKMDRRGAVSGRTFFLFNDILLHTSGGDGGWGLRLVFDAIAGFGDTSRAKSHGGTGVGSGSSPNSSGSMSVGGQYRLLDKFGLEDLTVVGVEDGSDQMLKNSFELRSSCRSFVVFADSPESKQDWIDSIRLTKDNFFRDQRTLQRDTIIDSTTLSLSDVHQQRLQRRTSGPVPTPRTPQKKSSLPPRLDFIPPTPAASISRLPEKIEFISIPTLASFSSQSSPKEDDFALPPLSSPSSIDYPPNLIPITPLHSPPSSPDHASNDVHATVLARRWSDGGAAPIARSMLESVVYSAPTATGVDLSRDEALVDLRVIDHYSAPIWVPDSKVDRCMRCPEFFSMLRRRHHCRLCGSVVCWACSTKNFVIPSLDPATTPDRIARACDRCYADVFPPIAPQVFSTSVPFSPIQAASSLLPAAIISAPGIVARAIGLGLGMVIDREDEMVTTGGGGGARAVSRPESMGSAQNQLNYILWSSKS